MGDIADDRIRRLREAAKRRKSTPDNESPSRDMAKSTPKYDAPDEHTPTPVYTSQPAPRENMVRTQHFLRPDQIAWLDSLVKRTGGGVTRSDWLRYAVDELRRTMEARGEG